jgi:non-ribosomal peptide synthetase component E (peptide arylation enzyme)
MANFKCPKQVILCEDFPRTSLGKVRKGELVKNYTRSVKEY